MSGTTHLREQDGEYQWVPKLPMNTCSQKAWKHLKEIRDRYQYQSPIRCVSCGHPVPFFEAFDICRRGGKDKIKHEVRGTLTVGVKVRMLKESNKPEHTNKLYEGKPLHIMTWMVIQQTFDGPGCKDCQGVMMRLDRWAREYFKSGGEAKAIGTFIVPKAFIDLTQDVLLRGG